MSIQAALSNALSSLAAEQRHAMLLANNIANASTPGYVRRDLPRSERLVAGIGSGVNTLPSLRMGDAGLAATSRAADASEAFAKTIQAGLEAYNTTVGQPADARSLSSKLGAFQTAMTALSSAPDNAVSQSQALAAAQDLVDTLHDADAAVGKARAAADLGIATDVTAVNKSLDSLAEVDRQMALASARGASTAEYEDRRDVILAEIATKLPIRTFDNGPGNLIVMTDGGNTLYDSTRAHHLSFTSTPFIAAEARHPTDLSAIAVEGQGELRISGTGSIAAGFELRDEILPNFVDMLDQVGARLLDSFQSADATLTGTQAGLFTDAGDANWDSSGGFATFTGLSRRIAINAAADPDQGGVLWKIRTGMQATSDANAADNSYVLAALDAMEVARGYDSATGLPSSMNLSQAASQSIGLMQSERAVWTDRATTRSNLALEARQDLANKTSVNVDEELQRLLLVQQTYSASVQIIQAASRMLDELNQIR
ncbi:flagellar hook-associated protein FlgK [Roseomonas sp. 18066]|uniref:flagellar hook-associated protein FlgK n=1 Tax=Roseomonas sp. 18066 TaxID=2681412 RepID=UPI00135B1337|nr:flagellar hook-associated protein FlgK [Roseomonas sp. 18066]